MLGSRVGERLSAIFLFILIHSSVVTIVHTVIWPQDFMNGTKPCESSLNSLNSLVCWKKHLCGVTQITG